MPAVIRVKRKKNEAPLSSFLLKKPRLGGEDDAETEIGIGKGDAKDKGNKEEARTVLRLAGTITAQDDSVTKEFATKKVDKLTASQLIRAPSGTQRSANSQLSSVIERSRAICREASTESRYRVIDLRRTTLEPRGASHLPIVPKPSPAAIAAAAGADPVEVTIVDVEQEAPLTPHEESSDVNDNENGATTTTVTTTDDEMSTTSHGTMSDVEMSGADSASLEPTDSDSGYVYDLYIPEDDQLTDSDYDYHLSITPHTNGTVDYCYYRDDNSGYYSDDSNDENNPRNDYPDESESDDGNDYRDDGGDYGDYGGDYRDDGGDYGDDGDDYRDDGGDYRDDNDDGDNSGDDSGDSRDDDDVPRDGDDNSDDSDDFPDDDDDGDDDEEDEEEGAVGGEPARNVDPAEGLARLRLNEEPMRGGPVEQPMREGPVQEPMREEPVQEPMRGRFFGVPEGLAAGVACGGVHEVTLVEPDEEIDYSNVQLSSQSSKSSSYDSVSPTREATGQSGDAPPEKKYSHRSFLGHHYRKSMKMPKIGNQLGGVVGDLQNLAEAIKPGATSFRVLLPEKSEEEKLRATQARSNGKCHNLNLNVHSLGDDNVESYQELTVEEEKQLQREREERERIRSRVVMSYFEEAAREQRASREAWIAGEAERLNSERMVNQIREIERLEREERMKQRLEKEKEDKERLLAQRQRAKLEREKLEKESFERQKREKERLEREKREKERLEREKRDKERLERLKREKERLEKERLEKEKREKEKLEKEKREKERLEKEKREKERLEKERLEKEKREREKLEKERLEKEKREKEKELKEKKKYEKQKKQRDRRSRDPA